MNLILVVISIIVLIIIVYKKIKERALKKEIGIIIFLISIIMFFGNWFNKTGNEAQDMLTMLIMFLLTPVILVFVLIGGSIMLAVLYIIFAFPLDYIKDQLEEMGK